ncbi:hypothetical protein ACFLWT_00270 [Chloroflexota bacterium]
MQEIYTSCTHGGDLHCWFGYRVCFSSLLNVSQNQTVIDIMGRTAYHNQKRGWNYDED